MKFMKKLVFLLVFSVIGISSTFGQVRTPIPNSTPQPARTNRDFVLDDRRLNRDKPVLIVLERKRVFETLEMLYRKPSKSELEDFAPNEADLTTHKEFLKQPGTGIFRLAPDAECSEDARVVSVSSECLKRTMPGSGASFSFRYNTYRIPRLSDLTFTGETFLTQGVLTHGILVNIGDVPLNAVSLQTEGGKYLKDFVPVEDYNQALKVEKEIENGIKKDDFLYKGNLAAQLNSTYLLRSTAYRGKHEKVINGYKYDELKYDEREDVIIAFRVIRKDADDSITVIWKELSNIKAPKLVTSH